MFWRARSFWLAALSVAYVAFAALGAADRPSPFPSPAPTPVSRALPWIALFGLPLLLAVAWNLTAPPARGEDRVEAGARSAARACFAGGAILLAALTGPGGPAFVALTNLGAAIASMAALVALARLGSLGGLVEPAPSARRLDAAAFGSLLWTVAVALPAVRALAPDRSARLDPILVDYATVAASIGALGLGVAVAFRVRSIRRLELGVANRATAAALLAAAALSVGVLAALTGVAFPERVLPLTATVAAAAIAASAVAREATALSRALRVILALAALAVPPALLGVFVAQATPSRAGAATFAACAACALAGLAATTVARRLAPRGSRWLGGLDAATAAAINPTTPTPRWRTRCGAARPAAGMAPQRARRSPFGSPPSRSPSTGAGYAAVEQREVPAPRRPRGQRARAHPSAWRSPRSSRSAAPTSAHRRLARPSAPSAIAACATSSRPVALLAIPPKGGRAPRPCPGGNARPPRAPRRSARRRARSLPPRCPTAIARWRARRVERARRRDPPKSRRPWTRPAV